MNEYRVIGKDLSNDQVKGKVTGKLRYSGDIQTPEMLYMRLCPGTVTHGMVRKVHTERAQALPGVRAVFTCLNTPEKLYDRGRVDAWETVPNQERLFDPHIRYLTQRVAAVVATSEEIAAAACRLIEVEYDELPAVISMEAAMQPDAPKLFEQGNIFPVEDYNYGDYASAEADLVHRSTSHIGRMTHLCMETQACRARWDPSEEKLTIWTGCQSVFGVRNTVAELLDLPYSKVRAVKMPMGGSFGVKQETVQEPLAAYAAWKLQADVRLIYTREEQMVNTMMKHSLDAVVESKVLKDGTVTALSLSVDLDAGAYVTVSQDYVGTIGAKISKVYSIPNLHFDGRAVCTNTPINGSFRSWGSCEVTMCLETHWNQIAKRLGMDPVDFRLKNCHEPYGLDIRNQASIGKALFKQCLLRGRERFGWEEKKQACTEKNRAQRRYRYGVGVAMTSHSSSFYPYRVDMATAGARLQEDGSLNIHVPIHDHGCGTVMAMKKIASEITEIDLARITLGEADTENSFYDHGCYASRSVYAIGQSVKQCCEKLMELLRQRAAAALHCEPQQLAYQNQTFCVAADPARHISLQGIAQYSIQSMGQDLYCAVTTKASCSPGVPAVHFTEVEVDTYTGFTRVVNCLSVHDIGKAINPDLCRGQVGSGIQQGIGMALCEEMKLHPQTGESLITNFKNYEVANACDMPDYDVLFIEEEEPSGPFGAKSIGEVVMAPVAPAIVAAVNDALDTELTHLPLTPAVILEALEDKQ